VNVTTVLYQLHVTSTAPEAPHSLQSMHAALQWARLVQALQFDAEEVVVPAGLEAGHHTGVQDPGILQFLLELKPHTEASSCIHLSILNPADVVTIAQLLQFLAEPDVAATIAHYAGYTVLG
jgi:hypothetical protein